MKEVAGVIPQLFRISIRSQVGIGSTLGALADRIEAVIIDFIDSEKNCVHANLFPQLEQVMVLHNQVCARLT